MKSDYKLHWTTESQMFYNRDKIIKCEGKYIYDETGKKYLDLNSGTWNVILGYNRKEFKKVLENQLNEVQFVPNVRFCHEQGIKLSSRILGYLPNTYTNIFYTCGGGEAVETALKIAKQYWYNKGFKAKHRVISLYESYHGSTLGAMSVSGDPWDRIPFDTILNDSLKFIPQYCYNCRLGLTKKNCNYACIKNLEYIINFYGEENISSLIIEPIMGVGGIIIPDKKWIQDLVNLCHKYNIIVIFDEVSSGFGRCGNYFSFLDYEVEPDIITFGKAASNGVQALGGAIVKREIFDTFVDEDTSKQFRHGFTNSGHPIACAVGNKVLDIFEEEKILSKIKKIEKMMIEKYSSLKNLKYIGEIRIKGLMVGIEMKNPFKNEVLDINDLEYRFKEKGIIMSRMYGVICFMPTILTNEKDIDYSISCIKEIIESYIYENQDKLR